MASVEDQLKDHDLRVTDIRKQVFRYFRETGSAVSHAELELYFSNDFDRVTIYRTLKTFLDKGILHQIPTESGAARYALCHADCSSEQHEDNHVHFKCTSCGKWYCLYDQQIPELELEGNYSITNAVLLYEGICASCQ